MTFELIPQPASQATLARVNGLMTNYNDAFSNTLATFKNQWLAFWDRDLSVADMQAQLDLLAATTVTDLGQQTNALAAYFAKARRFIAYVTGESPDAFADSMDDTTGQCQRFLTPGWTYSEDPTTGRVTVIAPCEWVDV